MKRNDNHGLSNCLGSIWCADCGGACSQDEQLTRDVEPRESWADYRAKMLKAKAAWEAKMRGTGEAQALLKKG